MYEIEISLWSLRYSITFYLSSLKIYKFAPYKKMALSHSKNIFANGTTILRAVTPMQVHSWPDPHGSFAWSSFSDNTR